MRKKTAMLLMALCASIVVQFAPALIAAENQEAISVKKDYSLGNPPMKKPSWINRPAKATPAKQAGYADILLSQGRLKSALRHYSALVRTWHNSTQAPYAQWQLSSLLLRMGRDMDAFRELQYLIKWFPNSFPFEEAIRRQFMIANRIRAKKHARLFFGGFAAPEDALPLFAQVIQNAPRSRYAPEALFQMGLIKEEARDFEEAVRYFDQIYLTYPTSQYAEQAAFHRAKCLMALTSLHPRNEPTYREAIAAFAGFLTHFSDSSMAQEAEDSIAKLKERLAEMAYERAAYYDKKGSNPRSAIIALSDFVRNFPYSNQAIIANRRIQELKKQVEETGR